MEILEFGDRQKRKIIFVHGFQMPYQIWNPYIEHYKKDYHVIVPILPGHNPKQKEDFISFAQTAKDFEDYYISRYGEKVYAIYGMSMGGLLAATLWQNKKLKIEKMLFDGSPLISVNPLIGKIILQFYLKVTHKSQQRNPKTVEQIENMLPGEYIDDFLDVLDNMKDITIKNCTAGVVDFKLQKNKETEKDNTEIYFYHGTKCNEMLAKKSAQLISKNYKNSVIKTFKGRGHFETMMRYPEQMIKELDRVLL